MIFTGGYRVGEIIWKELMWLSWRMTITRQRKKKNDYFGEPTVCQALCWVFYIQ